jgi:hypothetical protein
MSRARPKPFRHPQATHLSPPVGVELGLFGFSIAAMERQLYEMQAPTATLKPIWTSHHVVRKPEPNRLTQSSFDVWGTIFVLFGLCLLQYLPRLTCVLPNLFNYMLLP